MRNTSSAGLQACRAVASVTLLATSALVLAQAPTPTDAPTFDSASVKPNNSGTGLVGISVQPGGLFVAGNVTLRLLIQYAYRVQPFQVIGGPSWIASDRFDVNAKGGRDLAGGPALGARAPLNLAVQTLLADRFKLGVHTETRDLPIYSLVIARSDGALGPQLKRSDTDCNGPGRGGPPIAPSDRPACGTRIGPGNLTGGGTPIAQLAATLSNFVNRPVVDRTGLAGNFDFDLKWTPEGIPAGAPPPPGAPPGTPAPTIDPNGPSIFTAVQEQLGLRLESARGPVDVVVVDRAEKPGDD